LKQIAPKSKSLFRADEDDNDSEADPTKDVLTTLDGQLKLLKRELKMKDDKIAKLTEHSMMMANHMDRLKGEIARLHGKLYDADLELQVKCSSKVSVC
jgi:chromosome segregation ATPase